MRLSMQSSNIIHQILEKDISVIYEPHNSLFDHILCSCIKDINYYIFSPDADNISDNCVNLPESNYDIHSYDICLYNNVLSVINKQSNIANFLHVNSLLFQHNTKSGKIKKEDALIIDQKIGHVNKIFFDDNIMSSWNLHNSHLIQYGIPLNLFHNNNRDRHIDILLLCNNKPLIENIYNALVSNNMKCETVSDIKTLKLDDINNKFNESKTVLDLENNTINQLCALACGCEVAALAAYSHPGLSPWIITKNSIDSLVEYCIAQKNVHHNRNYDQLQKYLEQNFNYDQFKIALSKIIQSNKRKAFIL